METAIGGAIVGAVVAVAAPSIITGIGQVLRPVAKGIIKGGVVTFTAVSELVSETGEQFNDLVAEAKAELHQNQKGQPAQPRQAGQLKT